MVRSRWRRCNQTRMFRTNQSSSLPSVCRFSPVHVCGEEGQSSGLCSVHRQPRIQLPPESHDSLHLSRVGAARHTEEANLQPSRSHTHICQDHLNQHLSGSPESKRSLMTGFSLAGWSGGEQRLSSSMLDLSCSQGSLQVSPPSQI